MTTIWAPYFIEFIYGQTYELLTQRPKGWFFKTQPELNLQEFHDIGQR